MYRYALRPSCVDFLNDAFRQHISTGSRRTPLKCADQFLGNEAKGRAGRIYPLNYARRDISIEGAGEGVAGDATRGSGQARYGWVFPPSSPQISSCHRVLWLVIAATCTKKIGACRCNSSSLKNLLSRQDT